MNRRGLLLALALALLVRIPALVLGVEHYGDAPVRIELAERWAQDPHVWRGFGETYQYGPLHLSLLGGALRALPDRYLAPKLLSLFAGLAIVALIWLLTARLRGKDAAMLAACAVALSPLHIQASTTGASEAPFLALLLGTLALVLVERPRIVLAAVLIGAAGLIRYDGWLYVPLIGAVLLARTRSLKQPFVFCFVATLPAVAWIARNAQFGDPLAPIDFIDADHQNLANLGIAAFGKIGYRIYCLPYWPEAVLLIATPIVGLLAMGGAGRALWKRASWELAALAWIPVVYFTFRGAVLANFRPMARFAMVAATLSLPYAWDALEWLGERLRKPALALAAFGLVVTPLALTLTSYNRNGGAAEWARPLSAIGSTPPGITQAARWLRANATKSDVVLLDATWHYLDVPLAFESALTDHQFIRVAWTVDFEQRWARLRPTYAVLLHEGTLEKALGTGDRVSYRGVDFCIAERFVYAEIYRRCPQSASRNSPAAMSGSGTGLSQENEAK